MYEEDLAAYSCFAGRESFFKMVLACQKNGKNSIELSKLSRNLLLKKMLPTLIFVAAVAVCLFSSSVYAGIASNCTDVRKEVLTNAQRIAKFSGDDMVKVGVSASDKRRHLWSGEHVGLKLHVYDDEEHEPAILLNPKLDHVTKVVTVDITIKRLPLGKEATDEMVQKSITSFSYHKQQAGLCVPLSVSEFSSSRALLSPHEYSKELGGVLWCTMCATTLGIAIPIVLNLIVGETFYYWCINSSTNTEDQCNVLSMEVVLALEAPIVVIGGAIVMKECFVNPNHDCTPSMSGVIAPQDQ